MAAPKLGMSRNPGTGAKSGAVRSTQDFATGRKLDGIVDAIIDEIQKNPRKCDDLRVPADKIAVARAGNDPATHGFSILGIGHPAFHPCPEFYLAYQPRTVPSYQNSRE